MAESVPSTSLRILHCAPTWFVATGRTETVREFCRIAFAHIGLDYREHVRTDAAFMRPAEVDLLIGDASKARDRLGWQAETSLEAMIAEMVEADLTCCARAG